MSVIALVTQHPYPTDQEVRVAKLSRTFKSAGYGVVVLCPRGSFGQATSASDSALILRFGTLSRSWVRRVAEAAIPLNPLWIIWLIIQFRRNGVTGVVTRDLRLSLSAIVAARLCRIPAVADLGENHPAMVAELGKRNFAHWISRNVTLIRLLEWLTVRLSDQTWVVVKDNEARLKQAVPFASIKVISNYPERQPFIGINRQLQPKPTGPTVLIFVGIIDSLRGLDTAIRTVGELVRKGASVLLHIYGDGPERRSLEQLTQELQLQEHVFFQGWLKSELVPSALANADIGLVLHRPCELTQTTVPNKLFDYMAAGLPVVATPLRPIAEVLLGEGCGIVVPDDSAKAANEILKLIRDPTRKARMGALGKKAAERYVWEAQAALVLHPFVAPNSTTWRSVET